MGDLDKPQRDLLCLPRRPAPGFPGVVSALPAGWTAEGLLKLRRLNQNVAIFSGGPVLLGLSNLTKSVVKAFSAGVGKSSRETRLLGGLACFPAGLALIRDAGHAASPDQAPMHEITRLFRVLVRGRNAEYVRLMSGIWRAVTRRAR